MLAIHFVFSLHIIKRNKTKSKMLAWGGCRTENVCAKLLHSLVKNMTMEKVNTLPSVHRIYKDPQNTEPNSTFYQIITEITSYKHFVSHIHHLFSCFVHHTKSLERFAFLHHLALSFGSFYKNQRGNCTRVGFKWTKQSIKQSILIRMK